jgi:hypothetical protein
MATVIPNQFDDVAKNLSQLMVQLMIENRRMGLEEQRVGLEERRVASAERSSALESAIALAPFLPDGVPVADMPFLHGMLQRAIPEVDFTDPSGFGGLTFNPMTVEDFWRPILLEASAAIPEEERGPLVRRAVNRQVLGTAASPEELEAQQTQSEIYLQSWRTLSQDPAALTDILRRAQGLDPIITFEYKGETHTFDNSTEAQIAASLLQHQEQMGLAWFNANTGRIGATRPTGPPIDLAGELIDTLGRQNIPMGRAGAMQIVSAYEHDVRLQANGELTDDNSALQGIIRNGRPAMRAGAQIFVGAHNYGVNGIDQFFQSTPGGQQFLNFLELGNRLDFIPADQRDRVLRVLTADPAAAGVLPSYQRRGVFGGRTLQLTAPPETPTPGATAAPRRDPFGGLSPSAVRTQMETDARALSRRELTVQQINERYPDARARAAVVRRSQQLRQ